MAVDLSKIIAITSNVVDTSSSGIDLVCTVLTQNSLVPFNDTQKVLSFTSSTLVGDFFGTSSDEYQFAVNYFLGWDNSTTKPKFINFARYVDADIAPYIRGGAMTSDQLTTLKAVTAGVLNLNFDSTTTTITGIDLSSANSFSDVASLIQAELRPTLSSSATCTYDSITQAFTISNEDDSGTSTVDYATDNSGTGLGSLLKLTEAKGAVLSQGSVALSATDNLDGILTVTRDWISFTQIWDVSDEEDYVTAMAFSKWANDSSNTYLYLLWSNEGNLIIPNNTSNVAAVLEDYGYASVFPIYNAYNHAAFAAGLFASIDYTALNSTISFASKTQSGLAVSCSTDTAYDALIANNFNFYANFASANDQFKFTENGKVTGIFKWIDNFYNNRWLADQVQIAEATLLAAVNKLDYGSNGQSLLYASLDTVMKKAIYNGIAQTGNSFDNEQAAILKNEAGIDITSFLTNNGYYIKLTPPAASDRANRPAMKVQIWYTNNGSFYSINNTLTYVN